MQTSESTTPPMHYVRMGTGKPLLLLHGLGGSWKSWSLVLDALSAERDVIAVDLPGFGETAPLPGLVSIGSLADAVTAFLRDHELLGVDVVGSSMGARLVLELARRGVVGAVVSLDPGGFWKGWQKEFFAASIRASVRLVRLLQPVMPLLTRSRLGRTLLFAQFSAKPWKLSPTATLTEMRTFAAAPSFDALLDQLVDGPPQLGMAGETPANPITIVWGRQDRVCFPDQAKRAQALFPTARLVWFEGCGHFPHWDVPIQTARLILSSTAALPAAPVL